MTSYETGCKYLHCISERYKDFNLNDRIRILLVDDEEAFVMNLAKLLKQRGFEVDTAFNGMQALEKINREAPFHVIVLDIKMPVMDGISVLKEIKQISSQTEVLMLTGHASLETGIQAMREGAFDYLMKPCDIEDLCEKIKAAYEVETIKRHPVLWPRSIVKEIESPSFIRLEEQNSIRKVLEIFANESAAIIKEVLYVLDQENRIKGVITKRDLMTAVQKAQPDMAVSWEQLLKDPDLLPDMAVKEVMQHKLPVSAEPDENISEVARRMMANNVRSMPVVKQGRITAIIRLQDILRHIEHEIE
jgi:two-component system response regulator HydG